MNAVTSMGLVLVIISNILVGMLLSEFVAQRLGFEPGRAATIIMIVAVLGVLIFLIFGGR